MMAAVMADSTTTIDYNNLDRTNDSINMTDNSYGGDDEATGSGRTDLAAIKTASEARLEIEDELEKLKQMQAEVDKLISMGKLPGVTGPLNTSIDEKIEADNRSVYVSNVDYSATVEDLKKHFHGCGNIKRASILLNKFNGHPKGFAYIEFNDKYSVRTAMELDETLFKGRQIKVMPKRTNKPGLATTNWQPRGMQGRGRSFRGGFSPYNSGYRPVRSSRDYSRSNYYSPYIVRRGPAAVAR